MLSFQRKYIRLKNPEDQNSGLKMSDACLHVTYVVLVVVSGHKASAKITGAYMSLKFSQTMYFIV